MQMQPIKDLLTRLSSELVKRKILLSIGLVCVAGLAFIYMEPAKTQPKKMSFTNQENKAAEKLPIQSVSTQEIQRINMPRLTTRLPEHMMQLTQVKLPNALGANPVKPEELAPLKTENAVKELSLIDSQTPEYVILQPIEEATFSSETTASVSAINVKEGSYFQKNDILLELDCRVQQAEYAKSKAQQKATNIALKSADKLKSYGSISEYELVKARAEAAMVDADVNKLSAILDKCNIKAPFNGAVSDLMVHQHESVKPGDPLMKIVNTEHIIVELEVPSDWLQWLHINSAFQVHVNEINKSIPAKIVRINPKIEPVSQTVKIVGEISNAADDRLLPGMSGQAVFPDNPNANRNTKSIN